MSGYYVRIGHQRGKGKEEIGGLTNEQGDARVREGKVNISPKPVVKSYRQIIFEHTFNLFNAYNFCIALALVAVKAKWTFMAVQISCARGCMAKHFSLDKRYLYFTEYYPAKQEIFCFPLRVFRFCAMINGRKPFYFIFREGNSI